ncbi:hypothetical protein ACLOJK_015089 [Asimina triloba]
MAPNSSVIDSSRRFFLLVLASSKPIAKSMVQISKTGQHPSMAATCSILAPTPNCLIRFHLPTEQLPTSRKPKSRPSCAEAVAHHQRHLIQAAGASD